MNLKMKISLRNIIFTVLGIMFLGIGVALSVRAGLGSNALDILDEIIANKTGISFGRITFIAQILMIVFAFIFDRKTIGIGTLMAMFLTQFPVDITYSMIDSSNNFIVNLMMVIMGVIVMAFGAALIIKGRLGMGTYEALTFSIANRFNFRFVYVKYVLDSIFLLLVIIFRGTIGIGTIITYLFLGRLIELFCGLLDKYIND